MSTPDVTVLIATRNRVEHLGKTLDLILLSAQSSSLETEVVIIDNGSSDGTPEFLKRLAGRAPIVRVLTDPIPGKSGALNRSLHEVRGTAIVFTDDDVHVPASWVDDMAGPIILGEADAVCGRVRLAKHLERPWLTEKLRMQLAEVGHVSGELPGMVGANMAASRTAATKIGFDENLGPGARGFADDVIFNLRLKAEGFHLIGSTGPEVEHHLTEDRLSHEAMKSLAQRNGMSHAYLWHHWLGSEMRFLRLRWLRSRVLLARAEHRRAKDGGEGISDTEYDQLFATSFFKSFVEERKLPRRYER